MSALYSEPEEPTLPTPKPREITVTLDHQGRMVISRSPRQR